MVDIGILIHHNRKKEKSFNENGIGIKNDEG